MGFTIVFIVIVLLVIVNSVRVRNQTRDKSAAARKRAERVRQLRAARPPVPSGTPIPPGNAPIYSPGDSLTYRPGDSATYAPAPPVGSRPNPTPPARIPPPPPQAGDQPRSQEPVQPPYATRIERRTAARDQAVLDRDQRRTARTDPTQAPLSGSTAITSAALDTTLTTPYQPSSLVSSLSTSLSSTLFDTPAVTRPSTPSVFAAVSAVPLPRALEEQVIVLVRDGNEVDAVRIIIDQLDVGILEATKTVRSYGTQAPTAEV